MADAAQAKASALSALATLEADLASLRAAVDAIEVGPPTRIVASSWGDGVKDATAAIQMELDAMAVTGGVVVVPAGRYMIDALKSVNVPVGVTLKLDPSAIFEVKPNSESRYVCVRVYGAMEGGRVLGDRLAHTYTSGSAHEHGYGIEVYDNATLTGTIVSECTGDGVGLKGDFAVIKGITCLRNRRNGMSVFAVKGWRVSDSTFAETGALGSNGGVPAGPWAGVDIEPDGKPLGSPTPVCEDGEFLRCKFLNNDSAGIKTYKNASAPVPAVIRNIRVLECEMAGNSDGAWFMHCAGLTADRNNIHDNNGYGLHLETGTTTAKPIEGNTFFRNLLRLNTLDRSPDLTESGFNQARDLKKEADTGACVAGVNTYR